MQRSVAQSRYLMVAVDLARRVTKGEFEEGQLLSGRSLLASQYNVSPETIRRAMCLLAEMDVVEVKPQSGTIVKSAENAGKYVRFFEKDTDIRASYDHIRELLQDLQSLGKELMENVDAFAERRISLSAVNSPFPNYEIPVPDDSGILGKSIGEIKFWGRTGCTIVGIIRGDSTILSPGPYAEFMKGDVMVVVGEPESVERAARYVQMRESVDV